MKVITIGRDPSCNIVINDPKISRRHAIIRVSDFGKIEVVDLSTNGTSVNGNPLRKNVPYPVTRNNQVTFAGVSKLNWDDIPNPIKLYKWIAIGLAGLIALAIAITAIVNAVGSDPEPVITQEPPAATATTPEGGSPKISSKAGSADSGKEGEKDAEKMEDNTNSLLKPMAPAHRPANKVETQPKDENKDQNAKNDKSNGNKGGNVKPPKKNDKATDKAGKQNSNATGGDNKNANPKPDKKTRKL